MEPSKLSKFGSFIGGLSLTFLSVILVFLFMMVGTWAAMWAMKGVDTVGLPTFLAAIFGGLVFFGVSGVGLMLANKLEMST